MPPHEDRIRLQHMLDRAREAAAMVEGKMRESLDRDRSLNLSLVRLLEVVGEGASRVSADTRDCCREIPWAEIVSLRNRLIHGYDEVDFDILWQIVTTDLPPLIAGLDRFLRR